MKVDGNVTQTGLQSPRAERIDQTQPADKEAQGSTTSLNKSRERDSLNISQIAEQLNQASTQGQESQEFRADKVAAITDQLANNSYQVSGRDVAQKMLTSMRNGL